MNDKEILTSPAICHGAVLAAMIKSDSKSVVDQLKSKYSERFNLNNYKQKSNFHADVILFQNWAYRVEKGWYGFALGEFVPYVWTNILDEFFNYVEIKCPDFKIHQVKIKFGGIRIYLKLNSKESSGEINEEIEKLEEWLQHPDLGY